MMKVITVTRIKMSQPPTPPLKEKNGKNKQTENKKKRKLHNAVKIKLPQ